MLSQSVAAYRLCISEISLPLRLLLIVSASLPVFPFVLATQSYLSRMDANTTLLAMIVGTVFFVPAHEAMHGLIFWLYRRKVTFGFKPWSAFGPVFYAASVGSRFSRGQYQLACLAPQILTVALALFVSLPLPDTIVIGASYAATLNLGGGVVDIFVAARLLGFPKDAVVEDSPEGMEVYLLPQT